MDTAATPPQRVDTEASAGQRQNWAARIATTIRDLTESVRRGRFEPRASAGEVGACGSLSKEWLLP
jgi:hypothetical protein